VNYIWSQILWVDDACKDIYCWAQVEEQDEPFGKMRIESYTVRVIATPILVGGDQYTEGIACERRLTAEESTDVNVFD
jgi:hypothetical protein